MAALTCKKHRQLYRNYLVVFLVLSTAKAQLASGGNQHESFYNGMEELQSDTDASKQRDSSADLELDRTSPGSSTELDRTPATGNTELKRTENSVHTETDSDRQESSSSTEVDRTDSSSVVESEKQDRTDTESDRTLEGSLVATESDSKTGPVVESGTTLLKSQHEESDLTDKTSGSATGLGPDGKQLSSTQVGLEEKTASSEQGGESDKTSESPNAESELGTEASLPTSVEENPDGDLGNGTLVAHGNATLVTPGNTTGENSTGEASDREDDGNATGSKVGPKKVSCAARDLPSGETPSVKVVNGTELIHQLKVTQPAAGNVTAEGDCVLVMFYAPWCPFSAAAAPAYHAVPRAFPAVTVLAIDAVANSHLNTRFGTVAVPNIMLLNTRFGTVAVPNIMLFYNGKALSRFNQSERSLDQLRMFVKNHTALRDRTVKIEPRDFAGPLPTSKPDYFLWVCMGGYCLEGDPTVEIQPEDLYFLTQPDGTSARRPRVYMGGSWCRYISTQTEGLEGDPTVEIQPEDFAGPLPTAPTSEPDYFLWASWGFLVSFGVIAMARSSPGKRLLVRLGILVPQSLVQQDACAPLPNMASPVPNMVLTPLLYDIPAVIGTARRVCPPPQHGYYIISGLKTCTCTTGHTNSTCRFSDVKKKFGELEDTNIL
ncbi:cell redox homeostasis [Branchiostoma belcheri]|nr:cell redox homeostasis [Branchiostoma belcheri]